MPARFEIVSDKVCLIRYTGPLLAQDIYQSYADILAYAQTATQPILAIGDYMAITKLSTGLISAGVHPGQRQPAPQSSRRKIVVFADLPIIMSLASAVSKILGIEKLVVVRTHAGQSRGRNISPKARILCQPGLTRGSIETQKVSSGDAAPQGSLL